MAWQKRPFFMEFWPIFYICYRLRPYLCSKRGVLEFYKQATHRRRSDKPFLLWGPPFMTGDGPKNGPFWAKNGRFANVLKWSKTVEKGPKQSKRDQNGQLKCFLTIWDPLEPTWNLLDHFKQKFIFCSQAHLPNPTLGQKNRLSEIIWMKGGLRVRKKLL